MIKNGDLQRIRDASVSLINAWGQISNVKGHFPSKEEVSLLDAVLVKITEAQEALNKYIALYGEK